MFVTTIGIVNRTDTFVTEGRVLQGMYMSLIRLGCELELCSFSVSTIGVELSEVVRGI